VHYNGAPLVRVRAEDGKVVCRVSGRMFPDAAGLSRHVLRSKFYRECLERAIREGKISLA